MDFSQTGIALVVLSPIATALVFARIYIKVVKLRTYGADDTAIILTWMAYVGYAVALGLDIKDTNDQAVRKIIVAMSIANAFYVLTSLLIRIAIGLFFLRLVTTPAVRRIVWVLIVISTLNNFYDLNFVVFFCGSPVNYVDKFLAKKCFTKETALSHLYEQAAVNSLTDLAFSLLPIQILWGSQMSRTKLFSVGVIILLGSFITIFSIARIPAIQSLEQDTKGRTPPTLYLWSSLEISIGLITACLPSLSSSFQSLVQRFRLVPKIVYRSNGRIRVRFVTARRVSLTMTADSMAKPPVEV